MGEVKHTFTNEQVDRFYSKISKEATGCWEWQGASLIAGYGKLKVNDKYYLAHRFSYMIHRGEIPDGKLVCHHCDNPKCVNPGHLFVGTHKDNNQDMWNKGRNVLALGEDTSGAKLTKQEVIDIRLLRMTGEMTLQAIADYYGLSHSEIVGICKGDRWGHVPFDKDEMKKISLRLKGEQIHSAKLTKDNVVKIKSALKDGSQQKALAIKYGVSKQTINNIAKNKVWKHIKIGG